ncbi:MAG: hypothetical protein IPP94_18675 [Ignavibacteria bacterium]|nr:hypothetical protein [Ignavibacteria bacterium]
MEERTADFGDVEKPQERGEYYAAGVLRVPLLPKEPTLRQALYTTLSSAIAISWVSQTDITTNYTWFAGMVLLGIAQNAHPWYRKHVKKDADEYAS